VSVEPYYSDEWVTIYHGDCREILPGLEADVVITDPPYGIGLDYGHKDNWRPNRDTWRLARRVTGELHMTVSNRHLCWWLDELRAAGFEYAHTSVYWNRCRAGGNANGQYAYAWEPILHFGTARLMNRMLSDVIPHTGRTRTDHPAERDLGAWVMLMYPIAGSTVLDPFMGSGTTLRAAKDLGRKAIGIEIEERYCEIAAKRCAQEVLAI